jgi:hypothetical protein
VNCLLEFELINSIETIISVNLESHDLSQINLIIMSICHYVIMSLYNYTSATYFIDYSRMTLTDMGMDLPDTQRMIVYSEYTSHCFGSAVYLVQLCK